MSKLNIFILDNLDNEKEEMVINKPKSYQELLKNLNQKYKLYEIFIFDNNNKILINDEDKYKKVEDIIFIKEIDNIEKSIFSLNYEKLSESKQDILDDKYNCNICNVEFKGEKPLLCYRCQKLFHKKCLENWNEKCNEKNVKFNCPKCKYELPLKDWLQKLNYKEERLNEVNILKKQYKFLNIY